MARQRVGARAAWHHVMNHGVSGRCVFPSPRDIAEFVRLLDEMSREFLVEIHAYCVLGSHYHLLLRATKGDVVRAMRHLDGTYAHRFHGRHDTDGPLFRGPHRALLVRANRHLLEVSRYIHLNPVEAGLVSRAEEWPHSSFRAYLDPAAAPRWLRTAVILGAFGSIGARRSYRRFVHAGIDPGTRDFYGRTRLRPVLAGDDFREEVLCRASSAPQGASREFFDHRLPGGPVTLSAMARAVSEEFGAPGGGLRLSPRGRTTAGALARGALVHAARRLAGYRLGEIAAWLGYSSRAGALRAAIRFQEAAESDPALAEQLASVVKRLEAGPSSRT